MIYKDILSSFIEQYPMELSSFELSKNNDFSIIDLSYLNTLFTVSISLTWFDKEDYDEETLEFLPSNYPKFFHTTNSFKNYFDVTMKGEHTYSDDEVRNLKLAAIFHASEIFYSKIKDRTSEYVVSSIHRFLELNTKRICSPFVSYNEYLDSMSIVSASSHTNIFDYLYFCHPVEVSCNTKNLTELTLPFSFIVDDEICNIKVYITYDNEMTEYPKHSKFKHFSPKLTIESKTPYSISLDDSGLIDSISDIDVIKAIESRLLLMINNSFSNFFFSIDGKIMSSESGVDGKARSYDMDTVNYLGDNKGFESNSAFIKKIKNKEFISKSLDKHLIGLDEIIIQNSNYLDFVDKDLVFDRLTEGVEFGYVKTELESIEKNTDGSYTLSLMVLSDIRIFETSKSPFDKDKEDIFENIYFRVTAKIKAGKYLMPEVDVICEFEKSISPEIPTLLKLMNYDSLMNREIFIHALFYTYDKIPSKELELKVSIQQILIKFFPYLVPNLVSFAMLQDNLWEYACGITAQNTPIIFGSEPIKRTYMENMYSSLDGCQHISVNYHIGYEDIVAEVLDDGTFGDEEKETYSIITKFDIDVDRDNGVVKKFEFKCNDSSAYEDISLKLDDEELILKIALLSCLFEYYICHDYDFLVNNYTSLFNSATKLLNRNHL